MAIPLGLVCDFRAALDRACAVKSVAYRGAWDWIGRDAVAYLDVPVSTDKRSVAGHYDVVERATIECPDGLDEMAAAAAIHALVTCMVSARPGSLSARADADVAAKCSADLEEWIGKQLKAGQLFDRADRHVDVKRYFGWVTVYVIQDGDRCLVRLAGRDIPPSSAGGEKID